MAFAFGASAAVVNAIVSLIQPAEVHGAKEHIPGPAGEGLQAHGERRQNMRDVHPALVPPNASIGRDAPDLEVLGVRDRPQPRHVEPIGGGIERRRPPLAERFVGPHLVEGMPEGIEAPLLGAE